jgi:hypothetical protein
VSTVQSTDVAARVLEALARRDFPALAETFNEGGRLRGLVPSAVREEEGRVAIAGRFEFWNGGREDFELLDSEVAEMQDVVRLRWRARGVDPEDGPSVYEQTAYAMVEGEGFAWMNLVCSGDRPASW